MGFKKPIWGKSDIEEDPAWMEKVECWCYREGECVTKEEDHGA